MRATRLAAGLLLVVAAATAAPATFSQPIAVLPFKNLNDDGAIDWMAKGIAETMVSDMRRTGKVKVVERDQLDLALSEILLQGAKPAEDSTAAQLGRMVGAKTVVVGSYQKAGTELRINARFVEVETGVVLDTAKATGPVTRVFALQDEIVDRLLGGAKPASRPVRKASDGTVKAYELWTKSLGGTDAEKVGYLKASLAQDPEFPYALEDLAALEARIASYRKARESAMPGQETVLWDRIADKKLTGYERALAVDNLLKLRRDERRYRALLADAKKILALGIPNPPPGTIAPSADAALFAQFEAQWELRLRDDAVRTGEKYLNAYPTGFHYKDVEAGLDHLVTERRRQKGQETFFEERMARVEEVRKEVSETLTGEDLANRLLGLENERCDVPWRFSLVIWERMAAECGAIVKKYEKVDSAAAKEIVAQARYRHAMALGELGRFEEAVPLMQEIAKDAPTYSLGYFAKETLEKEWPADAKP
jgi:TolB-like protein